MLKAPRSMMLKAGRARAVIRTAPMAPKVKASERISTKKRLMPVTWNRLMKS
ncbi:hypothetical protein D3C87_1983330 [compost metagenome]